MSPHCFYRYNSGYNLHLFNVSGSDTGHLGNPLVQTNTGGVRPEFLLVRVSS